MTCSLIQFGMGAGGFSPATLPGLVVWLRPGHVTLVGGGVSVALDQSGVGNNFQQTTAGLRLTIESSGINGKPSFSSTAAGGSYLVGESAANALITTAAAERIFVGQNATDPPSGNSQGISESDWGTGSGDTLTPYLDANIYDSFGSNTRFGPISHAGINMSEPYVLDTIANPGTWQLFLNGSQLSSATNTFGLASVAPQIMGPTIDAMFGDYFVFNAPLSAGNRSALMAWLNDQWGTAL